MADPDECKLIIKSILTASPVVLTVRDLLKQFKEMAGYELPYRQMGYGNPNFYLHSLTDTLQIYGDGLLAEIRVKLSEKSAHVSELIANQRRSKPKRKPSRQFYTSSNYYHRPQRPMYSSYEVNRFKKALPTPSRKELQYERNTSLSDFDSAEEEENLYASRKINDDTIPSPNSKGSDNEGSFHSADNKMASESITVFNNNACSTPKSNSRKSYCTSSSSGSEGLVKSREIWCGNDNKTGAKPKHQVNSYSDEINYKIPYIVQDNLRTLLRDYPNGIKSVEIPNLYKERFKVKLNYSEFGNRRSQNLMQFLAELHNVCHYRQVNKGDFIIFFKNFPIPDDLEDQYADKSLEDYSSNEYVHQKPGLLFDENMFIKFPPDVLTYDDYIKTETVQTDDKFLEIHIAEVYDPTKFWFVLKDNSDKLVSVMEQMEYFYDEQADKYLIPNNMLRPGLYCAIKFQEEYHRAVIVSTYPNNSTTIKALFIDFGTVSDAITKGICFLHKSFKDLPSQAIRGRLATIIPVKKDSMWPRESAKRFLDLIMHKPLVGEIHKIDKKRVLYEMFVVDTSKEKDVIINDVLVQEGLAIFAHQEQEEIDVISEYEPIYKDIHLYPEFEHIEAGLVPSALALNVLVNHHIDFHIIFPSLFKKIEPLCEGEQSDEEELKDECGEDMAEEATNKVVEEIVRPPSVEVVQEVQVEQKVLRPPPGFSNIPPTNQQWSRSINNKTTMQADLELEEYKLLVSLHEVIKHKQFLQQEAHGNPFYNPCIPPPQIYCRPNTPSQNRISYIQQNIFKQDFLPISQRLIPVQYTSIQPNTVPQNYLPNVMQNNFMPIPHHYAPPYNHNYMTPQNYNYLPPQHHNNYMQCSYQQSVPNIIPPDKNEPHNMDFTPQNPLQQYEMDIEQHNFVQQQQTMASFQSETSSQSQLAPIMTCLPANLPLAVENNEPIQQEEVPQPKSKSNNHRQTKKNTKISNPEKTFSSHNKELEKQPDNYNNWPNMPPPDLNIELTQTVTCERPKTENNNMLNKENAEMNDLEKTFKSSNKLDKIQTPNKSAMDKAIEIFYKELEEESNCQNEQNLPTSTENIELTRTEATENYHNQLEGQHNETSPLPLIQNALEIACEEFTNLDISDKIKSPISMKTLYNVSYIESYNLHCILYKGEPYVVWREIQKNYLQDDIPIVQIRRMASRFFIELENISLKAHPDLTKELLMSKVIEKNTKLLDIVLLKYLPDMFAILSKNVQHFPDFEDVLKNHKADSEVWTYR